MVFDSAAFLDLLVSEMRKHQFRWGRYDGAAIRALNLLEGETMPMKATQSNSICKWANRNQSLFPQAVWDLAQDSAVVEECTRLEFFQLWEVSKGYTSIISRFKQFLKRTAKRSWMQHFIKLHKAVGVGAFHQLVYDYAEALYDPLVKLRTPALGCMHERLVF